MNTIFVYSNETGKQVASFTRDSDHEALDAANDSYCTNDYHFSTVDMPISNAA